MLIKIKSQDVELGMHIKEMCGSWLDHPFWRSKFIISAPKDLESLKASNVKEVWVDLSKSQIAEGLRQKLMELAGPKDEPAAEAAAPKEQEQAKERKVKTPAVEMGHESEKAGRICKKANTQIKLLMKELREDGAIRAKEVLPLVQDVLNSVERHPGAIISMARLKGKGDYVSMHAVALSALMVALAKQMGWSEPELRLAGLSGLLLDIGKASIPDEVLSKQSSLTEDEFAMIKKHPQMGLAMLMSDQDGVPQEVLDACLHHHERMDGRGYPSGLRGDQIPLIARMGAICDTYDAITSERPYKKGLSAAEAIKRMAELRGSHFDEKLFQLFVKSVGIYPIGSLVQLESKRLAVVCDQNMDNLLAPVVKVFYSIRSQQRFLPEKLDLAKSSEKIVSREDPEKWGFQDINAIWMG